MATISYRLAVALVAGLLGLLLTVAPSQSDPQRLKAAEIETLLSGNTAKGSWNGTAYRQFFASDGGTVYLAEGSPPSRGKWRVNTSKNLYESWWERSGWSRYPVVKSGDAYAWVEVDGTLQPFTVLTGRQID